MGKFVQFISKVPVPICGLALGCASLDLFISQYNWYEYSVFALISTLLISLFFLRLVFDLKGVIKDLDNPAVFGILPTSTMTLMILAVYLSSMIGQSAIYLWWFAVIMSFVIMFFFVRKFVIDFKLSNVFPSWFVIFVGYVVASVTSPTFGTQNVGQLLFCIGCVFYFILLAVILLRFIKVGNLPEPTIPNIAIFTAPINLCIAGYIISFGPSADPVVLSVLLIFGMFSYLTVLALMPMMLRTKFYPSYAAFTFPLVISAVAIYRAGSFFGVTNEPIFQIIHFITLAIAISIVIYVTIRYMMFLYNNVKEIQSTPETKKR